jgi:hypothetical protein
VVRDNLSYDFDQLFSFDGPKRRLARVHRNGDQTHPLRWPSVTVLQAVALEQ